ncbi:MAG: glucan-binding protein [bacterium]|nr:glucan-binding protein [bacterium]
MRKQTKLVAVLSAASLLAIGASMTSFAATGWVNENGTFYYYDADGEMVTNEWKKDGNAYFYLGDEGEMLTSSWVDNEYYVGPNGAMVTNAWVKTMPEDIDDEDPDSDGEAWFYFNNKGKKVTGKEMKINGKYYRFDDDGKMLDGWQEIDNKVYYFGDEDDGARKSGWLWLETASDDGDVDEGIGDDFDTEAWYYFDSNGVRVESKPKKINGKWYSFNQYGQMNYGWTFGEKGGWVTDEIGTDSDADLGIGDLLYYFDQENGARVGGFIKIAGPNATGKQDDTNWYYFKDGKAKYAKEEDAVWVDKEGVASTNNAEQGLKKIIMKEKLEGKYFAFDELGRMKTGKQPIKNGDDYDVYYFDDNGYMKTGKVTGVEDGDDESTYYFNTNNAGKGKGVTGDKDGYLYYKGRRQEAEDDYKIIKVSDSYYLVNTKGKIQKSTSKTYEDIENEGVTTVKVDKNGKVTKVNDVDAATFFASYDGSVAPKAPYFD